MSLSNLTRRAFLVSAAAGAATLLMPRAAAAKPLEELTAANFSRQVYHNRLPVVVLFYEAGDGAALPGESTVDSSRRMEQVIEALADKYDRKVAFFKVAMDHNDLSREQYQRVFGVPDTSPLTVIYGRFDVLTGQQSLHNFKIDTVKGGPRLDVDVPVVVRNLGGYWIPTNLLGQDNVERDGKVYRAENTFEDWKTYAPGSALKR